MVAEVVDELDRQGHPGVSAALEFAVQGIDEGADTAAALGRRLGVSRQGAAKTIAALEQLGYVESGTHPADARRKHLRVTERGHEMVAIGRRTFDALRERWAKELAPGQLELVENALRRLSPQS